MMANQVSPAQHEQVKKRLNKRIWINEKNANAYYIHNGMMESAIVEEEGLKLIKNELIDGASDSINEMSDFLLGFLFSKEE